MVTMYKLGKGGRNNYKKSKPKPEKACMDEKATKEIKFQIRQAQAINMMCKQCGQEVCVLQSIADERGGLCSMCYRTDVNKEAMAEIGIN